MATHLFNHLPTTTLSYCFAFKLLYHVSPSYDHLRVFGFFCYPNLFNTATYKLSPRSSACIFAGYAANHKGFQCLDLSTNKLIISRHVLFDESIFPFSSSSSSPLSTSYNFLSFDDDSSTLLRLASCRPSSSLPRSTHRSPGFSSHIFPPITDPSLAVPNSPLVSLSSPSSGPLLIPVDDPPAPTHPMTKRSKSGIFKPSTMFNLTISSSSPSPLPHSHSEALRDPHWKAAMEAELSGSPLQWHLGSHCLSF